MNRSFQVEAFQRVFQDIVAFQTTELPDGGRKCSGKSPLIQVQLEEDSDERLVRATMLLPFFLAKEEANRKITSRVFHFLDLCLPAAITPPEWMESAARLFKNTDERLYETEHDGIVISLARLKPEPMFLLTAEQKRRSRDESPPPEARADSEQASMSPLAKSPTTNRGAVVFHPEGV